jgi:hypothetical protein
MLIIDREQIAGVPLLIIAPEHVTACPTVFFVHGFTASPRRHRMTEALRLIESSLTWRTDAAKQAHTADAVMWPQIGGILQSPRSPRPLRFKKAFAPFAVHVGDEETRRHETGGAPTKTSAPSAFSAVKRPAFG